MRKRLPASLVLFLSATSFTPGLHGVEKKFRPTPFINQFQPSPLSDGERILLLETFQAEQRDTNDDLDSRLDSQVNTLIQTETLQARQINLLESRVDLVYRFGGLMAFVLTLSAPVLLWILNKSRTHHSQVASTISSLASDIRVIKMICNIQGGRAPQHLSSVHEEEERIECLV